MIENLDITTKMSFCLGFSYFDHSFGNLILIFLTNKNKILDILWAQSNK